MARCVRLPRTWSAMSSLQALGPSKRPLVDWTITCSRERAARTCEATPDEIARAEDVAGIPPGVVAGLRSLNRMLRRTVHPLAREGTVPIKFWNAPDVVVMYSALQYLPSYLLQEFDYEREALLKLPSGYRTAQIIFEMLDQIENEGMTTAI